LPFRTTYFIVPRKFNKINRQIDYGKDEHMNHRYEKRSEIRHWGLEMRDQKK